MRGRIPVTVSIDKRPCEAHLSYSWAGGGSVLTLSTVLPEQGLAAELISACVGHADTATVVMHLMLGRLGQLARVFIAEHAHEDLDPMESARECAYDHAHELVELLRPADRRLTVQLDENSFTYLERIE